MSAKELKHWIEQLITLRMDKEWIDSKINDLNKGDPLEMAPLILVTYRNDLLRGMPKDEAELLIQLLIKAGGARLEDQSKIYGAVMLLEGYVLGLENCE